MGLANSALRIYLDHNATTPLREPVLEAMVRVLRDEFGNPSSTHREGARARSEVEEARRRVAECMAISPDSVFFTAGATEANNTVLRSLLHGGEGGRHLVTTATEHPSVLEPVAALEADGIRVTRVPVNADGLVDPAAVEAAIRDDTALVSVIWANNETGVLQPMEEIARRVKARGARLHSDATQALGKVPVDLSRVPADFLSASAHKLGGPKGVGCLVAREPFAPLLRGGGQETGLRGGTENVAGIVGFGAACALATRELDQRVERYAALRDRLWEGIRSKIPGVRQNGAADCVLPNTLNVEFEGAAGEVLLQALDLEGVALSVGAACHAGSISPSHVLTAMGRTPEQSRASLRLSVGHGVDESQIDRVLELLEQLTTRVRAAGSV